ncbi:Uncharacterized protein Rs2_47436 [Raphanus sativus]|nr:Uncharacterized protein Rs2_47436 [Raphanus sativus]
MGTSGDGKSGEGMRKRLKISVPHFDNSALVKTFSKNIDWEVYESGGTRHEGTPWKPSNDLEVRRQDGGRHGGSLEASPFSFRLLDAVPCECPLGKKSDAQGSGEAKAKNEVREGNGGWHDVGKHDERARSFKGVLLNGKGNQQYKEKDSREYYGKGKGKMYGDSEAKWAKTGEKGHKRGYNNGGATRGDEEGFRYKSTRKEDMRSGGNKGRSEFTRGQTSDGQVQQGSSKEAREEGEIVGNEEHKELMPSQEFQKALAETQADGAVAVSDPVDEVNGNHMLESMLEKQVNLSDDETMTYGEIRDHLMAHGIDVDAVEIGEEETEMDIEDLMQLPIPENAVVDAGNQSTMVEGKEETAQEAEKKQGTKKKLFKPTISTAGSNKMRIASALVSPHKRAQPKQVNRQGNNAKHAESKGASLPKSCPMN